MIKKCFFFCLICTIFFLGSCSSEVNIDPSININIQAKDLTLTVNENPKNNIVIGKVNVSAYNKLELIYTLVEVSVDDAITIDGNNGNIVIKNPSAFNYEENQTINARYLASDGISESSANIKIIVSNQPENFISTWNVSDGETVTLNINFNEFIYDFTVNWGDGSAVENFTKAIPMHVYEKAGKYQITIKGKFPAVQFASNSLLSIDSWGDIVWQSTKAMFKDCENVQFTTTEVPNLSKVIDMSDTFRGATNFNSDIGNWDVSNVSNMAHMFDNAVNFSQDLGNWDVSRVSNMSAMFVAIKFPIMGIEKWNVGNVLRMDKMFQSAEFFNQNISNWNVSNVRNMNSMFQFCRTFNQDISNWNVSNVRNMNSMFYLAKSFDQDLSDWATNNVTDCGGFASFTDMLPENYPRLICAY